MIAPKTSAATLADEMRVAVIIRDLSPRQVEAWLTFGRRMVDGMPAAEAEALMWAELAAPRGSI